MTSENETKVQNKLQIKLLIERGTFLEFDKLFYFLENKTMTYYALEFDADKPRSQKNQ